MTLHLNYMCVSKIVVLIDINCLHVVVVVVLEVGVTKQQK